MSITDRNLKHGQTLVGKCRGKTFVAKVVETEKGLRYHLGEKEYTSPSAAGSAVTGHACNGWKFWSLAGPKSAKPKAKRQRASRAKAPAAQPKPEATVTVEMTPEQKREAREEEQATQPTEAAVEA